MSMSRYVKRNFVFVKCYSCERPLARVVIGTETMCPVCNKWTVAQKKERCNS